MSRDIGHLLARATASAVRYRTNLDNAPARSLLDYHAMRERFAAPLPEAGSDPATILDELAALAEPGLMPTTGPRFFAWVMGASHPAGVAADLLVSAWGQNAGYQSTSPAAAAIEEVAESWLLDMLDLPRDSGIGFTTGATVANGTCLAAARTGTLRAVGWDPDEDGLFGAPPVHVLIGADAHSSLYSSLQLIGFGRKRVITIETDELGRMRPAALEAAISGLTGPKIVIAQAGQINTGAFDSFADIVAIGKAHDAWVHVDGAFGLWARATPSHKALTSGIELCDSWVTDGHKWLQAPYDCGFAIVRDKNILLGAMSQWASYLPAIAQGDRVPSNYVPELSRRARGIPVYALLRTFGRQGMAELIERHCRLTRLFATRLAAEAGIEVVAEPVINQLIVNFGTGDSAARKAQTEAVIARTVEDGTCYVAGASWRGDWVMRLSVTSVETTEADIDRSADAIIAAWRQVRAETRS
ncbi:pyridoxal phosphate-dependent decarboxylase family protein [Devosia ginsengisoli]|uniref:Aspartate aminotransferase family protein n=1 Tax=Devosia ginsengisoli TaxID=400770 RepID=A0A5B8LSX4_9HYPH|nr:aminotransferase class V-fold PLP-dependent enzyme [Devosia ginsengisoli]QDZ11166.1 aspartate aminotransferase family protein [Devosia ginsengisoli]